MGNNENTPGKYETTLARPLDLGGSWECALIDINYPHTWINLNKEYIVVISAMYLPTETAAKGTSLVGDAKNGGLIRSINELRECEVVVTPRYFTSQITGELMQSTRKRRTRVCYTPKTTFTFKPGQYDLNSVLALLQKHIRQVGAKCENTLVTYDPDRNRVKISESMRKTLISCYQHSSIFKLLGFGKQIGTNKNDLTDLLLDEPLSEIEYLQVTEVEPTEAEVSPFLKPINSIFVYSNITNYVLVGNTQTPLLGYFPVQTSWGDQGYWIFNPPYYVPVKESTVHTIQIRLCTDTGEDIQFETGNVICRLNFRRVGMLRGIV